MKKVLKRIFILFIIVMLFTTVSCFAEDELDIKEIINQEEGSLFDKTIAKTIGGIAQAVLNIVTDENLDIGFKSYENMLFHNTSNISPFSFLQWQKIMIWYKVFAYISGSLILIAVIIISYKMIASSISTIKRNEAKENLVNLLFGGVAIAIAPIFIKVLLFLNNSLVNMLSNIVSGYNIDNLLDNEFLSSIATGNPITTALVISMFIYIFVKLNIKFIVREFTLIVFTIFTPIVVGLWIINKNVTAAAIWSGQIMMNVFMQFIYCFVFLLFSSFISTTAGWAVTLIWAMMLLPIADVLMNCLQNLTSRIAGLDNNDISMRGMGLAAVLGKGAVYSINAIKTQFTNPNNRNKINNFVGNVKNFVHPQSNLSDEMDYNGNNNPIRNTVNNNVNNITNTNEILNKTSINKDKVMKVAENTFKGAVKGTKSYLEFGANLAEGNFNNNSNNVKKDNVVIVQKDIKHKIDLEENGDDNE